MSAVPSSTSLPLERTAGAKRTRAPYALRLLAIRAAFGAGLTVEIMEGRWADGPWLRSGLLVIGLLLLIPTVRAGWLEAMRFFVFLMVLLLIASRALGEPGVALVFLLPGVIAALSALILSGAEKRRGLRWAAWLATARDGLWRLAGLLVVAIISLAIANWTERRVFEAGFRTPLEGLSPSAGILAGALSFVALVWVVWRLPRVVVERQSAGSILPDAASDALWFGTLLCAIGVTFDLHNMMKTGAFSDALGSNSWLALAATAGFAVVRLRLPPALRTDASSPLWIVFLGGKDSSAKARRHAARLAGVWQEGPVTVLSEPDVALTSAGAHLRLARMRGRLGALFPQRIIHLADWIESLPPPERWQAVPVRELYARRTLWPELLSARLESNARIVVIDDALPDDAIVDRLRVVLPSGRTELLLPTMIGTDRLRARWSGIAVFSFDGPTQVAAINRSTERTDSIVRVTIIDYAEVDRDFAEQLAASLNYNRDAQKKIVRALALPRSGRVNLRVFAQAVASGPLVVVPLFANMAARKNRRFGPVSRLLASVSGVEYELLIVEPDAEQTEGRPLLPVPADEEGRNPSSFTQVIALLPPGSEDSLLTQPRERYTGALRRASVGQEQQVADVARRVLARKWEPLPVPDAMATAPDDATLRRPRVLLLFARPYRDFALPLSRKLEPVCEVTESEFDPEPSEDLLEQFTGLFNRADALVAIVGPDATLSKWTMFEIDSALESHKPVLPVLVAPSAELLVTSTLVPANRAPDGTLMYLAEYADEPERLDQVLGITAANIISGMGLDVVTASAASSSGASAPTTSQSGIEEESQ